MDPSDESYPLYKDAYEIISQISNKGNVVVLKAICTAHVPRAKPVAIKILNLAAANMISVLAQLTNGVTFLPQHPNILKPLCYFLCEAATELWVVMPYFEVGSLQSIISYSSPNGLPLECIAMVLGQVLGALVALHCKGLIHRGVKPGNIIGAGNGLPKLSDYGVSSSHYDDELPIDDDPCRLSASTVPYWLPPEAVPPDPHAYDHKSDVWSFGITALELFHGRPPVSVLPVSIHGLAIKIARRFHFSDHYMKPNPTTSAHNKCSDSFKDLVRLCLTRNPRLRPSTEELLSHKFFQERSTVDLPKVEERVNKAKIDKHSPSSSSDSVGSSSASVVMPGEETFVGWKLNLETMELEPEYGAAVEGRRSPSISESSHGESVNRPSGSGNT